MHNETKVDYCAHPNDWGSYQTFMLQHGSTNMAFKVPLGHNYNTYFVILTLCLLPLDTPLLKIKIYQMHGYVFTTHATVVTTYDRIITYP